MRWMAGRATLLAAVAGVGVAIAFEGLSFGSGGAFATAFVIAILAGATSFAVSMLLFVLTMPRLSPQLAVFLSLVLGGMAAFVVGYVLHSISGPVF
jgi:hypothetical protein